MKIITAVNGIYLTEAEESTIFINRRLQECLELNSILRGGEHVWRKEIMQWNVLDLYAWKMEFCFGFCIARWIRKQLWEPVP